MTFDDLIKALPHISEIFIPGYIAIKIFRYLSPNENKENFNVKLVESVVISYILSLFAGVICNKISILSTKEIEVAIILSVIISIAASLIRRSDRYKNLLEKAGRVSNEDDIWKTILVRSNIGFTCNYNNSPAYVEGYVKYIDSTKDGECNIVLEEYTICYIENKITEPRPIRSYFVINTRKLENLEVLQERNQL